MGMSASQGMIFMLVGSRSDLELEAQGITNDRMVLSRQQETIAKEYSDKVANRQLLARVQSSTDSSTRESVNLTLATLFELGYGLEYQGTTYTGSSGLAALKTLLGDCSGEGQDNNALQDLLISGEAVLIGTDGNPTSVSGVTNIYETYYTGDDAEAKAKYDTEISKVQRKDKELEVDLQHIETEHKSVEENIESVRKVIDKNIESSVVFNG
jgi:hypothetical protein